MSLQTAVEEQSQAVELKGSVFTLTILLIRQPHLNEIAEDLKQRLSQAPGFFANAPVVLDLLPIKETPQEFDFIALVELLRSEKLVPVGVINASESQNAAAIKAGLAVMNNGSSSRQGREKKTESTKDKVVENKVVEVAKYVPAKIVTQPVRSGQQVYAKGGDLIVLAAVNAGAEVIADGNIHIYAPLRGRALAGVQGDENARIFTQSFGAEMVAIAGHYRTFDEQPANDINGKAVQVSLDGEKLLLTSINP